MTELSKPRLCKRAMISAYTSDKVMYMTATCAALFYFVCLSLILVCIDPIFHHLIIMHTLW